MINENFIVSRRIESLMYDIRGIGGDEAIRVMAGQAGASHEDWGEFMTSVLLCDLLKGLGRAPIFISCDNGKTYPFEELFLV
jgi:hypothetical protein